MSRSVRLARPWRVAIVAAMAVALTIGSQVLVGLPASRPGAPQATAAASASVARGKPASQSSEAYAAPAGRAVDGNPDGDYNRSSVTHTDREREAWWQVDLGAAHRIERIAVWNRTDCCAERLSTFYVLVSDEPFSSGSLQAVLSQPGVSRYYVDGLAARPTDVEIGRTGRYVRVQLTGTDYLSLAEVDVMGTPAVGTPQPVATPVETPPVPPGGGAMTGTSDVAGAFAASPEQFERQFKGRVIRVSALFQQVQLTGGNPIVFVRVGDRKIVCAQAERDTPEPLARIGLSAPVWISGRMLRVEDNVLWLEPGCTVGTSLP